MPEKKTTPENKIIAMTKGTISVFKEHRPGAVARPSVGSDGPRALMAKKSNEPGEREKSERNFACLGISYRADMITIVFVIATVFEPLRQKTPNGGTLPVLMCLFLRLLNFAGH